MMKQLEQTSHLFGSNAPFIEEQYENYLADPASVSEEWREYFDKLQSQAGAAQRDVAHGQRAGAMWPLSLGRVVHVPAQPVKCWPLPNDHWPP